jgi:hypothetical protein
MRIRSTTTNGCVCAFSTACLLAVPPVNHLAKLLDDSDTGIGASDGAVVNVLSRGYL